MQTRSGIHQARRNHDSAGKQGTHLAFNICGLVILVLLMVSLIASRTVFNKRFVMHEVTSSTVETDLLDQVQARAKPVRYSAYGPDEERYRSNC